MASSTVSRSFGLLMEDLEVPDRMDRASRDLWLAVKLDDRRLESAPDTFDSWCVRLDRRRGERFSSPVCSLTLLVRLFDDRLFLSDLSFDFSEILTRSLALPRTLLVCKASEAAEAAPASVSPFDERLTSLVGPVPSRKLSAGMADISDGFPG